MKKCPFCAEEIQDGAIKCKHCGSGIAEVKKDQKSDAVTNKKKNSNALKIILIIIGLLFLIPLTIALWYIIIPLALAWYIWYKVPQLNKKYKIGIIILIAIIAISISAVTAQANKAPILKISEPQDNSLISTNNILIKGNVSPKTGTVTINNQLVKMLDGGNFEHSIQLPEERNRIQIVATNKAKSVTQTLTLNRVLTEEEKAALAQKKAEEKAKKDAAIAAQKKIDVDKVRSYYKQALADGKLGDDTYKAVVSHLQNGTIFSSYEAVVTAIDNMKAVRYKFLNQKDSISLNNKEQEQTLKDAYTTLAQEYEYMQFGMQELKTYLNKKDLQSLSNAKGFFSDAQNYQLSGVAKLISVMNYYGLLGEVTK